MLRGAVRDFLKLHPENAAIKKKSRGGSPHDCAIFTNSCCGIQRQRCGLPACRAAVTLLISLQMDAGRHHCQMMSSALSPRAACAVCQSAASALAGPQTPIDSTPTCPSIAQATSCLGNLKALVPV